MSIAEILKNYWSVILSFLSFAYLFSKMNETNNENTRRITKVEGRQEKNMEILTGIATNVGIIMNDIDWIKKVHEEIQEEYLSIIKEYAKKERP